MPKFLYFAGTIISINAISRIDAFKRPDGTYRICITLLSFSNGEGYEAGWQEAETVTAKYEDAEEWRIACRALSDYLDADYFPGVVNRFKKTRGLKTENLEANTDDTEDMSGYDQPE